MPSRPQQRLTVQTLGDKTYAIPDIAPYLPKNGFFDVLVPVGTVLALPVIIPSLALFTIVMFASPNGIRNRITAYFISNIMAIVAKKTKNQRKLLLQHVRGRVLDVGSGAGAYLPLLANKASHVVCLEPVRECHGMIREAAAKAGFSEYQITIMGDPIEEYFAQHRNQQEEQFDWIILGNVMCEVPHPQQTLDIVHQLLKPGTGHVYFSEHVASTTPLWMRKMQFFLNGWWVRVSGGCNCNRDTLHLLEGMGDRWEVVSWSLAEHFRGPMGNPFYMGLARKLATPV